MALVTTKGVKTKKKRGMTGSGDDWRDKKDYPTREAPGGTKQPPTYQCNEARCLQGCKGIIHMLNINATNQCDKRQCSLPGCWAMQRDTRGNGNDMRQTNWESSNAKTKKRRAQCKRQRCGESRREGVERKSGKGHNCC